MFHSATRPSATRMAISALMALTLAACGGGGGGDAPVAQAVSAPAPALAPAPTIGQNWSARLTPKIWHSLSSDLSGQVLLAGEAAGGRLNASSDGGATWTTGDSPSAIWIASDMTATGSAMVAVQYFGGMYLSSNFGQNWNRITSSPLVDVAGGLPFEGVTISTDGQRIAAVVQNGRIVVSSDGGANWSAGLSNGLPLDRIHWRAIDSSADGQVLVAVAEDPLVYLSTDAGANWTPLDVRVDGVMQFQNWYRVKMSADGNTIVMAANKFGGNEGNGIYVSHDRGQTWARNFVLTGDYTALGMSADGQIIGATLSTTTSSSSRVLLSTNAGTSFSELTLPTADPNWRAITVSGRGTTLAVAAGNFSTNTAGQLYTSVGTR